MNTIFDALQTDFENSTNEQMQIDDFLQLCKNNKLTYSTAQERLLAAIGEPVSVDTSTDPRLSRIFMNRTIRVYPAFKDFHGMEDTIERIVGFVKYAAQGLEERKQILYLLGPVGGGKSSLAERIKKLMEVYPIYVLAYVTNPNKPDELEISPVFESPLALFSDEKFHQMMNDNYGIDERYLKLVKSPWLLKRSKSGFTRFRVVKMYPSMAEQKAIAKTEPGDENNQDISSLVGKTDIRMLEQFSQNDTDAYSYSGSLNRANQGLMEFVEMFKAPIKVLHPLLTATQEGNYMGTEQISAIPFNGMVLAHSNEAEWQSFKTNKNNEAFIDRIFVVKVPYCKRVTEEQKIYEKMIASSELKKAPCAPATLRMMAEWSILTRLKQHENSTLYSKMRVYDGENIKETDPKAHYIQEYVDAAGIDEGMTGGSTRFAFKVLSSTFNHDPHEVAADPVHLMYTLEMAIRREQYPTDQENDYINYIKDILAPKFREFLGNEIQESYIESGDEFGQTLFDRYIKYADHWLMDTEYKDQDTGTMWKRSDLNDELEKTEKAAGISNPKDFRNECVNFVIRQRAEGKVVKWNSYEKLKKVIEKKMFSNMEDMLPIISFGKKDSAENDKKHNNFVQRMMKKGYTETQVRRLVEYYMRTRKA